MEILTNPNEPNQLITTTRAINLILPYQSFLLRAWGLFSEVRLMTDVVRMTYSTDQFTIIPATDYGNSTWLRENPGKDLYFNVAHFPMSERIEGKEVMNKTDFYTHETKSNLNELVMRKLERLKWHHDVTREYYEMQALKGIIPIKDVTGTVQTVDLFTEYGITPKVVDFALSDANADMREPCEEINGYMLDNVTDDTYSGIQILAAPDFITKFYTHPSVEKIYLNHSAANNYQQSIYRDDNFVFAGINFKPYRGQASFYDTTTAKYIEDTEGHAFPMGTTKTFATYFSPAEIDSIPRAARQNEQAELVYAKQVMDTTGLMRDLEIHTESNFLPICRNPRVLVKVTSS